MIKLFVIVVLTSSVVLGQHGSFQGSSNGPFCVKGGNYCTEARDCCSKACTSQKCIGEGPQVTVTTTVSPPTSTSNTLDNRFDGDGKPCQRSGQYCQSGQDCCSGQCLTFFRKCVSSNTIQKVPSDTTTNEVGGSNGIQGQQGNQQNSGTCSQMNQQCSTTRSCCAFLSCDKSICRDAAVFIDGTETLGYDPNNLPNRFGEGDNVANQTEVTAAPANVKCAEIGSKCYRESECCQPLRCHSFLHQCVT